MDSSPIALFRLNRMVKSIMPSASVYMCKNADDVIPIAQEYGCDVLITEIDFGRVKGEGIELAQKVKDILPFTNVIFVTGAQDRDYAAQIVKLKYSGYLTKPFSIKELEKEMYGLRYR